MVILIIFLNNLCFLWWIHQFICLSAVHKGSFFFIFLLAVVISCLIGNNHSSECEVVTHCGFDWHFHDNWCYVIFMCLLAIYMSFLKGSIQIFCLFLISYFGGLVFICYWAIHILYIFLILTSYSTMTWKYFLSLHWLHFNFIVSLLYRRF